MQTIRRLYNTFQPKSYKLSFDLSKSTIDKTFSGQVVITGQQTEAGDLRLHAKDLTIESVQVNGQEATSQPAENDELVIDSTHVGDVEVEISFSGIITDAMHGIYPCYFEVDGEPQQLIATQFESHHAREAFPCVDEPEAKATFDVTIVAPEGLTVLSNMPLKQTSNNNDQSSTIFETTPRMSTYLLAFVVGDLQSISGQTNQGVEVNAFATKVHSKSHLDFALATAIKSIEFFEDYFNVAYPLTKSDHVALPDFSSGAMENWGLITYRESCLITSGNSATTSKQMVATVIAHEVSHQWFGNLVTMRWWDDLWLNESFANLMEYVAIDSIYPEWNIWNTHATQESISALRRDRLAGVQPVKTQVSHPDEIGTLFDPSIVYAKGGRLLKMLWAYIGEDAWRAGLKQYFETNRYQNTTGDDLWQALSESSGKDVASFMSKWLNQSGYPVVDLVTTEQGYQLSQQRFILGSETDDQVWPIPLAAHSGTFPAIFNQIDQTVEVHVELPMLNKGNVSHFITNYDQSSLARITTALENGHLDIIDRLSLLHELSLLAYTPRFSSADIVKLLPAYQAEDNESVWGIISMVVSELKRFVEDHEVAEKKLKQLITKLALPLYETLGSEQKLDDSEDDIKLRATIVSLLSYAEYQPLIDAYLTIFRACDELESLAGETRMVVFGVAAKYGDQTDFNRLFEAHRSTSDPELRDDLAGGITSTRSQSHIEQLLSTMTDSKIIKPQDMARWYVSMLRNRYARDATWQWLLDNWTWVEETFKGDKSYDQLVRYSAMILAGDKWLEQFRNLFEPKKSDPALKRNIEVGIVEITSRTQWINKDKAAVINALDQQTD